MGHCRDTNTGKSTNARIARAWPHGHGGSNRNDISICKSPGFPAPPSDRRQGSRQSLGWLHPFARLKPCVSASRFRTLDRTWPTERSGCCQSSTKVGDNEMIQISRTVSAVDMESYHYFVLLVAPRLPCPPPPPRLPAAALAPALVCTP